MKRFTALVIMMAMVIGLLPAAQAEEPCQSWKPEMEWNADADKYLYGYKSGNAWVIEPQYDYVNEFGENGLAVVAKDGKYGIIDTTGAWALEPTYDDISGASPDGLRWFNQDGRYGVMDASCRQLHPADIEADWMGQFVNGSCVYLLGEKYGLVGTDGKKITGPVYDEIESWFEPADGSRPVRMGELWGILTADGTLRAPIQYEDVEIWSNGYARVRLNGKEGILKPDGFPLTELIFSSVEWGDPASEDDFERYDSLPDGELALVKRDGVIGAVDLRTGELAYPCAFASRSALVTAIYLKVTDPDQLWETVDRLGREAGLQVSWYPGENIIRLYGSDRMLRVKGGKCALSGLDGTLYTDYVFDTVQAPGLDGLFPAAQNGKWGKLDRDGGTAVEFLYDTKDSIGVNARFVSKWGDDSPPYALFTLDGKQVTDYIYWSHSEFYNGYAMVSDGSSPWGYIDAEGTSISERKYFAMGADSPYQRWYSTPFGEDGLAAVRYPESAYEYNIIDTQGRELLEKPSRTRPWRAGFGLWGYVDSENYRMGFVDGTGKIVIQPQYHYIEPSAKGGSGWSYSFDETGMLTVSSDAEGGGLLTQTIDITGKVVGEGQREQLSDPDVHEGLLWTSVSSRGHLGSDGGGWGFEDETGKLVVPHLYDAVGYFDQGYASVRAGNVGLKWPDDIWAENPALTVSGAVYGMLRDPRLPAAQEPSSEDPPAADPLAGLDIIWYPGFESAAYANGKGVSQRVLLYKNGCFGLYGYDGKEYAPPQFETVGTFDESGWAPAMKNGVWGRLSADGEFVKTGEAPKTKAEAQQEADGVTIVYDIGTRTYNLRDTATGALLLRDPQPYAELWAAGCGLYGYGYKNGTFQFLNSSGEIVIPTVYHYVTDPKGIMQGNIFNENGVAGVYIENEDGTTRSICIDTAGQEVPRPVWTPPKRNLGTVLQGELRGYKSNNEVIEIPCVFEAALEFQEDGYALVKKDGVWGLLRDPLRDEDPYMVSEWASAEVSAAESAGYVTLRCATYRTHPITRLQFAELVVNYLEKKTGEINVSEGVPFTDTFDETASKAHAAGIVQGVGDGRFDPYGILTREQLATMLWRAMNKAGVTAGAADLSAYTDHGQVSGWARDSVAALAGLKVMEGTGGGQLSPKASCSVEQAILLVYRAAEK